MKVLTLLKNRIIKKIFIGALLGGALLFISNALADSDTLRDLGTNTAPGEIPKWDGSQWRNAHDNITIVTTGPGLSASMTNNVATISVTFGSTGSNVTVASQEGLNATQPPVGAVVAWLKTFTNTPPTLPLGWVECDGQTLNNSNSVYTGQVIPNLNGVSGTQRFLRGSLTSGSTGGSDVHHHSISNPNSPNTWGSGGQM